MISKKIYVWEQAYELCVPHTLEQKNVLTPNKKQAKSQVASPVCALPQEDEMRGHNMYMQNSLLFEKATDNNNQ